jgi:hypothetical protein
MPGGLIQLVAVGIQDEKLTQDPEITFFKAVYRPYINFALESIEQTFAGNAGFGKRVQSEMSRNGDLVKDALLEVVLPALSVTGVAATASVQTITVGTTVAVKDSGVLTLIYDGVPVVTLDSSLSAAEARFAIEASTFGGAAVTAVVSGPMSQAAAYTLAVTFTLAGAQSTVTLANSLTDGTNGALATAVNVATAGVAAGTCAWAPVIGHTLLKEMSVEIGGQTIDRHYGRWYDIWMELTQPEEKREGFNDMIGQQNVTQVAGTAAGGSQPLSYNYSGLQTQKTTHASQRLFVPLRFWFNVNPGLALPIIALQYHQIKLLIEFRPSSECLVPGNGATTSNVVLTPSDLTVNLWLDYVFLDNAERRNYAQTPHEYLIDQLQFTGAESVTGSTPKLRLNFNHPVQELVWVVQEDAAPDVAPLNQHNNYVTVSATGSLGAAATGGLNPLTNAKLQLNGQDRFALRVGQYFNLVQAYNHHKRVPSNKGVFLYSFALQPEDYQPNGTANFSRIDTAVLNLTLSNVNASNTGKAYIYVRSYNLFRIASGMGGLAYAS